MTVVKTPAASKFADSLQLPNKRYYSIGEVSDLCGVKPHVLRYWEGEFPQLQPNKRRGNRRYYQYKDVLTIQKIQDLLYTQGYTINGARQHLANDKPEKPTGQSNRQFIRQVVNDLENILEKLS